MTIPNALPAVEDTPGQRDAMLTALKAGSTRARLIADQIDAIGTALRHRNINIGQALLWLKDEKLDHWVHLGPGGVR